MQNKKKTARYRAPYEKQGFNQNKCERLEHAEGWFFEVFYRNRVPLPFP